MNPMTRAREFVLDTWSALSHKAPLRDQAEARLTGWTAKSWVGPEHQRRLAAYMVLAAYEANVARELLSTSNPDVDRDERREYGDAGLIVDTVLSALLGETQEIVVPGAEAYDPHLAEPADDATDEDKAAAAEALAENAAARALVDRQEFLQAWADDVHLQLRLVDCARNEVRYGDGVWLLGWDPVRKRPTPAVMDPGFYFPVLPDTLDAYDYPTKVHFAWEVPGSEFPDDKVRVRRITYDVRPMELEEDGFDEDGEPRFSPPEGTTTRERPDGLTEVVRTYEWDTEPSTLACYLTDATWVLDDLIDPSDVDGFTMEGASYRYDPETDGLIKDVDLGIDFIPVVHIPNTPPGGDHYGQSSLARVLQLLDDLQNADTDAQASSSTTGSPILWSSSEASAGGDFLTGQRGNQVEVRPGAYWRLGAGGKAGAIDTSGNLAAGREYVEALRDRLLVNSRLPGALVGTIDPSEVPSGLALQLSFGPLSAMIRQMRLVRAVKHPLLLKMVQRLYQAYGVLDAGPTPRAEITLGSFLPADQAGTLELVKEAYAAKLISLETAVAMLLEVGFPVEDVAAEIDAIQQRDFEGANDLADATNDQAAVRKYLGLPEITEQTGVPRVPPAAVARPSRAARGLGCWLWAPAGNPGAGPPQRERHERRADPEGDRDRPAGRHRGVAGLQAVDDRALPLGAEDAGRPGQLGRLGVAVGRGDPAAAVDTVGLDREEHGERARGEQHDGCDGAEAGQLRGGHRGSVRRWAAVRLLGRGPGGSARRHHVYGISPLPCVYDEHATRRSSRDESDPADPGSQDRKNACRSSSSRTGTPSPAGSRPT